MDNKTLGEMRRALLQGGVAPRYVRRSVREWRDHYRDIVDSLLAQGMERGEAEVQANREMGDPALLVKQALDRPELQSWGRRHPWLTCLLVPLLAYILVVIGALWISVSVIEGLLNEATRYPTPGWLQAYLTIMLNFLEHVLPIVLMAVLAWYAGKRWISPASFITGLVMLAVLSGGLTLHALYPQRPEEMGSFGATWGYPFLPRYISVASWIGMGRAVLVLGAGLAIYQYSRAVVVRQKV